MDYLSTTEKNNLTLLKGRQQDESKCNRHNPPRGGLGGREPMTFYLVRVWVEYLYLLTSQSHLWLTKFLVYN